MTKIKEPVFTREELNEIDSGKLSVGYGNGQLIAGYDFAHKPFKEGFAKGIEILNGTNKKRKCHEKINSFGYARFDGDELSFGVTWKDPHITKTGQSAIKKYNLLLLYYLENAGWKGISKDKDNEYHVPLNNPENIQLLWTLSPSIGFYYKTERPDMSDIERLKFNIEMSKMRRMRNQGSTKSL